MERYIVTRSGLRVSISVGLPDIEDVFLSHCRTPMFSGQTDLPYTVGHHCLSACMIAQELRAPVASFVLLHEVETAVYGDIPGPVKCQEQRKIEKNFRDRFFLAHGLMLTEGTWDQVEVYDKLEQAASINFLGLGETVHDSVWNSATPEAHRCALDITRENYAAFPPFQQLECDSRLFKALLFKYRELIG